MNLFTYLDNCNKRRYLFKMIRREYKQLERIADVYNHVKYDPYMKESCITDWVATQDRIFYYTNKLNSLLR